MSNQRTVIPFRCPICGSTKYVDVHVRRPGGAWYRTPFLQCFGCSVMFGDPVDFAGLRNRGDGVDRSPRTYNGSSPAAGADDTYTDPTQKPRPAE